MFRFLKFLISKQGWIYFAAFAALAVQEFVGGKGFGGALIYFDIGFAFLLLWLYQHPRSPWVRSQRRPAAETFEQGEVELLNEPQQPHELGSDPNCPTCIRVAERRGRE